jgi:hypothetical protein
MANRTTSRKPVNAESTETQVLTPTESAPPTPALHLLPLNIARIVEQSDTRYSASRFALQGVLVEFKPDNTFNAVATDTKVLVHVEGECRDADEYPDSCIPALAHAPNGATSAVIPSSFWREAFKKAKTITRRSSKEVLKSVAVVCGPTSTTLASTDLEKSQCDSSPNVQGKFAPYDDIIRKTRKDGEHELRIAVDPAMLANLLTTISDYADEDSHRAELVFRFNLPKPAESETPADGEAPAKAEPIWIEKPFLVEARTTTSKFTGLMMPLAG